MLVVRDSGSRAWVLRYQIGGRRRDMGLGPYPEVGLADAREKALDARRLIKRDGKDPIAERRRAQGQDLQGSGRGADREQAARLAQRQACRAVELDARDLRLPEARRPGRPDRGHRRRPGRAAADLDHQDRDREPGAPADRGRAGLRHRDRGAHRRQPGPLEGAPRPPAAQAVQGARRQASRRPGLAPGARLHGRAGEARGHRRHAPSRSRS